MNPIEQIKFPRIFGKILSRFFLARFLGRFCQNIFLQDLAKNLSKILPRSYQELRLEQSWQNLMSSWQNLTKILLRSIFFVREILYIHNLVIDQRYAITTLFIYLFIYLYQTTEVHIYDKQIRN